MTSSNTNTAIKNITIISSTDAGWLTIALLQQQLSSLKLCFTLIQPTINKPSAAINKQMVSLTPAAYSIFQALNVDEKQLLKTCQGVFNLGHVYHTPGKKFTHVFGDYGLKLGLPDFHHYALLEQTLSSHEKPNDINMLDANALSAQLALANKFRHPESNKQSVLSTLDYGWNLQADGLYELAKKTIRTSDHPNQLKVVNENVNSVELDEQSLIKSVILTNQQSIPTDFLLNLDVEDALKLKECANNLPAEQSPLELDSKLLFNIARAQHSNTIASANHVHVLECGYLIERHTRHAIQYELDYDQTTLNFIQIKQYLLSWAAKQSLSSQLTTAINQLSIESSVQKNAAPVAHWQGNMLQLDMLSSCEYTFYQDQLERLSQALQQLITLWPQKRNKQILAISAAHFNNETQVTAFALQDFFRMHYLLYKSLYSSEATLKPTRQETLFENVSVSKSNMHRYNLFITTGHIAHYATDALPLQAWSCLFNGFGLLPKAVSPLSQSDPQQRDLKETLDKMTTTIRQACEQQYPHNEYLQHYCP